MTVTDLRRAQESRSTSGEPGHPERPPGHPERPPRWVPARAGICNVWRYLDETFEFDNGRLLLRGPNGSGKSKALELLLPFLYDASLRPNRLSTFGTADRSMHWNLMGDGYDQTTRVGYVWLEFRLVEPDGTESWFTCGARLQASKHTTTVSPDFFTTTQRVGIDLRLVDEGMVPLGRAALGDALGECGGLYASAADYRTVVRRTLFPSLNEQRFDALITALLQLRTPKLSQHLDPGVVSTLLSKALPPLGQDEIGELAEGFERLDRQREQLRRLDDDVDAAAILRRSARTYAQRVLRAAAKALIGTTSTMTTLTRRARESQAAHEESLREQEQVTGQHAAAEQARRDHAARLEGLRDSDSYKQGQELDRLREQTRRAAERATHQRSAAARRREQARESAELMALAGRDAAERRAGTADARVDAERAAERVSLSATATQVGEVLGGGAPADQVSTARALLGAALEARTDAIGLVRIALSARDAAVRDRVRAERSLERAVEAHGRAHQQREQAADHRAVAVTTLADRLTEWANGLREIQLDDTDAVVDVVESESAVNEIVGTAATAATAVIAGQQSTVTAARMGLVGQREILEIELGQRRARTEVVPSPPATRTRDRRPAAGAPLWRLVSFAPDVEEPAQAGIEAALQASGLLDAWVSPTGQVSFADGHDTFLVPVEVAGGNGRDESPTLADVLHPEPDAPVDAALLGRLLTSIGYGSTLPAAGSAAVAADGRWRLAGLVGSWAKPEPEFVGATARERARLRRIAELEELVAGLHAEIRTVETRLGALAARLELIAAERSSRPDYRDLDAADRQLRTAEAQLGTAADRVESDRSTVADCEGDVEAALRRLVSIAADHALPTDESALQGLANSLGHLRRAGDRWLDAHQQWINAEATLSIRAGAAATAEEEADAESGLAGTADREARELAERLDAVSAATAAPYLEILAAIDDERAARDAAEQSTRELTRRRQELAERIGELRQRSSVDADSRAEAVAARDRAAQRLRHLSRSVLGADAALAAEFDDDAGERVRATLEAAQRMDATWPTVNYQPKDIASAAARLAETMHQARQQLTERAELEISSDEDVQLLSAGLDGVRVGATELLARLTADRDRGHEDITAAERDLFDKTLTGDTRRHLASLIRQAGELVDRMSTSLEQVRTASNVSVRLSWQVSRSLPPGTSAARELLLKDPVRLSDDETAALHRFFRERIAQAREANTAASWEEQLSEVFDYTSWHQFVVTIDRRGGEGWQELTRRLHGALSGGEKAIALHLPLFAAVAAHYDTESTAPRLIMLDEVFVGVDTSNRGQVFALLKALDLDLVLTSDHEWCTYRELPGVAVHQLITGVDTDHAVTTARFVWTGEELIADDPDEQACAEQATEDGLW